MDFVICSNSDYFRQYVKLYILFLSLFIDDLSYICGCNFCLFHSDFHTNLIVISMRLVLICFHICLVKVCMMLFVVITFILFSFFAFVIFAVSFIFIMVMIFAYFI